MTADKAPKKRKQPKKLNQPVAILLRAHMKRRKFKAKEVAKAKFGITPEAFSNILKARTRPKAATFQKIVDGLCTTNAEKEQLQRAYDNPGSDEFSFELLESETKHNAYALSKIEMANQARARAVSYQQKVADMLDDLNVTYKKDYVSGDVLVDFLITINSLEYVDTTSEGIPPGEFIIERQIAIVCELDSYADRATLQKFSQYIWTSLCTDEALVIVPHKEDSYLRFKKGIRHWALTDHDFFEFLLKPALLQEAHIDKSGKITKRSELTGDEKSSIAYPIR